MSKGTWIVYIIVVISAFCLILGALADFVDPCWNVCGSTVIEHATLQAERSYEATAAVGSEKLKIQLTELAK